MFGSHVTCGALLGCPLHFVSHFWRTVGIIVALDTVVSECLKQSDRSHGGHLRKAPSVVFWPAFLWTCHLQPIGETKQKIIIFVQLFVYLLYKGIYGEWLLNMCIMLWTLQKAFVWSWYFSHYKILCVCQIWNKKTKVGISDLYVLVKKEREKPTEPPLLHCSSHDFFTVFLFVCFD